MRFERIALRNFRPYADVDLALDRGVTVVHGVNGSGKSSLLGACFFALYGSKALDDATLDDLVTTGEEEAEIDLQFVHAGGGYHVHRRLRRRGDRTTTVDCTMETPDGVIEGARDVRRYVTDMLRMDADAFVNCAYVRQGEVNKLIHATPSERQDTVDDLLQLGTLEEYRDRAGEARLAVKSVLAGQQERLAGLDDQIADKEAADLHDRLDAVRSERSEVEAEIERFEENEREARETLSEAEDRLAEYEDRREDLSEVEAEIEGVRERIAETEGEREELAGTIDDAIGHRDERRDERDDLLSAIELDADDPDPETVEGRIATLREDDEALRDEIEDATARVTEATTTAETARDRATELDAEADRLREEAVTAADRIDEIEATIEDRRERLTESRARRDDLRARFEDATVETVDTAVEFGVAAAVLDALADERESVVETLTDRRAEREAVSDRIERAEALLDEGKCPRCGQPVDGSPHVESVEDDRERHATLADECETLVERRETIDAEIDRVETLREAEREVDRIEDEIETVEDRIEEAEGTLADARERRDDARERAATAEETAEAKRETAAEADDRAESVRAEIADLNDDREAIRDQIDSLEELAACLDAIADLDDEIADARERRERLESVNDERRDRLTDLRDRRDELADAVDEEAVEAARDRKERAETYLEQVEPKLATLRDRRDELQGEIGATEGEIEELEALRERRAAVADRVGALETVHEECRSLESLYGDLKRELRRRNVERLERLLNETFDLVYGNDAYDRLELDEEYDLTVYQKDNEPLSPEQLSGGERALFNLSLRCAIYRLLAEGIDGAAPMPPLILDEPTVFLDSGHVSRLVDLIEEMHALGVEQVIVVSHDDELVGAADDLVHVRKDPTTNRSTVEREERPPPAD